MATSPLGKYLVGTVVPNIGAVDAETRTASVIRSPASAWAAAFTLTARAWSVAKSPSKRRDRVAVVLPEATPDMPEMDTLGIGVNRSKLDVVTPLTNVVPVSLTVTLAPLRVLSVRDAGLVDAILALSFSVRRKDRTATSASFRFESASCA